MTLDQLPVQQYAIITSVYPDTILYRRLLEMGFVKHTKIMVLKKAMTQDPIQVELRGYVLTLRKTEASQIEVIAL